MYASWQIGGHLRKLQWLAAAAMLLAVASACGTNRGIDGWKPPAATISPSATPANPAYQRWLDVLAQDGWEITEEEKQKGTIENLTTRIAAPGLNRCRVQLTLTGQKPVAYRVTAIEGFVPAFFGKDAEALFTTDNPSKQEVVNALEILRGLDKIQPCPE